MIERLDVIDIAAMRRHPTTGKGAVLVAGNDLPLGIGRGPIGGRIDLHEQPTARIGNKSPPDRPRSKSDLTRLPRGDRPVPLQLGRPVLGPHQHIKRHSDLHDRSSPPPHRTRAISHHTIPVDHKVVQRVGTLLRQSPPVIAERGRMRIDGLSHLGSLLSRQDGAEESHSILSRIKDSLPIRLAPPMPLRSPVRIGLMNLPTQQGPRLPDGQRRHLRDHDGLNLPSRIRLENRTQFRDGLSLQIGDLPTLQQLQSRRISSTQLLRHIEPPRSGAAGQPQGTSHFIARGVPLPQQPSIERLTGCGSIGPRIRVLPNSRQHLDLHPLHPGKMPLEHSQGINPPPRRKPLTGQLDQQPQGLHRRRARP